MASAAVQEWLGENKWVSPDLRTQTSSADAGSKMKQLVKLGLACATPIHGSERGLREGLNSS